MYFLMINFLTLAEISNFESHISNLICIKTALYSYFYANQVWNLISRIRHFYQCQTIYHGKLHYLSKNYFTTIKNIKFTAFPILEVIDAPYCTWLELHGKWCWPKTVAEFSALTLSAGKTAPRDSTQVALLMTCSCCWWLVVVVDDL